MNTAVAEVDVRPSPAPSNALVQGFVQLERRRQVGLIAGAVALLALLLAVFFMSRQADWRVLYANLSDKDGGAILAQLTQMNVPYRHAEGGQAILVPADKVHDTRLRLASQGLPRGSVAGFESMDSGNRLGMTQFQERLSFQRGLEGELTRSIQSLASVADARVHLALPNQNGFFREQQKPSASVLLTLHPGRTLDRNQVAGIVHLVASSVPEMNPKSVSVVDENGTLLSSPSEGQAGSVDTQQLQYVQQLEQLYMRRILDLLEPIVGRENVRAQVTADVDFSLTEQTSEQHRPNQGTEPAAVRSQQTIESGNAAGQTAPGVPGAVANQPPQPPAAPINGAAAPVGIQGAQNGGAGGDGNSRRESVINYEVDRTVRVTRGAAGTLRRVNAAVVVNHRTVTDARGQTTQQPLPPAQVEQMNALVREAIGFSQERGDSVNVMNTPFTRETITRPEVAWWQQTGNQDLLQSLIWPVGMLLLGLIIFFGMVRPSLRLMKNPAPVAVRTTGRAQQIDAVVDEAPQRPGLLPKPVSEEATAEQLRLDDARRLARENPGAVANIIKTWVSGDNAPAST